MVEGIDKRQRGCAIEGSAVVQSSRNSDGSFIDIGNAEIDFSHDEFGPHSCGRKRRYSSSTSVSAGCQHQICDYNEASSCVACEQVRWTKRWVRRLKCSLSMN